MSVRSAAPPRAGLVYGLLIAVGMIAAVIGALTMAYIVYEYVWADDSFQRRNPPPHQGAGQAQLPDWIVHV